MFAWLIFLAIREIILRLQVILALRLRAASLPTPVLQHMEVGKQLVAVAARVALGRGLKRHVDTGLRWPPPHQETPLTERAGEPSRETPLRDACASTRETPLWSCTPQNLVAEQTTTVVQGGDHSCS